MSVQTQVGNRSRRSLFLIIILIAATLATITGVAFSLGYIILHTGPTEWLVVDQVTLENNGSATFHLTNTGSNPITIAQIQAQGMGISGSSSVSLSSGNVVVAGSSLSLTVTLSGVIWQSGQRYDFTLVSTQGHKYPASVTA